LKIKKKKEKKENPPRHLPRPSPALGRSNTVGFVLSASQPPSMAVFMSFFDPTTLCFFVDFIIAQEEKEKGKKKWKKIWILLDSKEDRR
jgi:hypothetical protein